ncbi:MBL fold metallo-hydrolase [Oleiagrimonas sp. C23AA]|uniref:MBL fold metallo-hydrolase n=1 Tax=Oleiagrimonas sp. C23AA TaxID=2719047 RepID=UPI00141F05F7|nr:MBL fold metallo-hydrolase [Oleiagrimonas sp. C23AA]NII12094.1 MBL fold metallo-hydrolase [Oleiagrimonas sp. C23AA]
MRRNRYFDPDKSHHTEDGFRALQPFSNGPGDFRRWQRERRQEQHPKPPEKGYLAFEQRWWQEADFDGHGDALWWLGHASVLLRLDGLTVLTDPVLGQRASPVSFAGPRRRTPPAARVKQLPPVDVVLISHNHYDHLDRATVRQLVRRFPAACFLVPLGLARWLRRHGAQHVFELDWYQSHTHRGTRFTCVPAQHWSARTPWDRNRTLWGGWVMQHHRLSFYFAGDTGYAPQLAEIGQRLGPIDLAALPIGAYAPRWFMSSQHIDPNQAVQLHRELGIGRSLAIHWGAFELADDALDEPPRQLKRALREHGVSSADFRLMPIGARWSL